MRSQRWSDTLVVVIVAVFILGIAGCGGSPPTSDQHTNNASNQNKGSTDEQSTASTKAEQWERAELPTPVPEIDEDMVEKGKELFNGKLACYSCHGKKGRGDGPASSSLTNTQTGKPISPRNFHHPDQYKWGSDIKSIARTVLTGGKNPGSPMPPMEGTMTDRELWAVSAYVVSLQNTSGEMQEDKTTSREE